uniref:ATP synthase F0 subunit 6 n=1 Tax=Vignadula atrata TaxID=1289577 RepID=UPI001FA71647|nr:ATP synthase F0 subunit 6 [Vignadula atrata]ULT46697.1 ATP synthase F0 subunit 6 [Vignadula atrata]
MNNMEVEYRGPSKADLWANFDSYCFWDFSMLFLWVSSLFVLVLISSSVFSGVSRNFLVVEKAKLLSWKLVSSTSGRLISGFSLVVSSVFILLLGFNFTGLVPYAFSITSQLSVSLPLALMLCICLIISSIRVSFLQFYSSLIPSFAPLLLVPFLMIVEVITVCSRPLTLGLRLLINIISGHLIMGMGMNSCLSSFCGLMGSTSLFMGVFLFGLSSFAWMVLLMAELGVAFLQGYIFCILLSLYSNEHAK